MSSGPVEMLTRQALPVDATYASLQRRAHNGLQSRSAARRRYSDEGYLGCRT
jgi:hypothetical protein